MWQAELKADAPLEITPRGLKLVGIPAKSLPVQPEHKRLFGSRRDPSNPFSLSMEDMLKAGEYAPGWDARALRREWETWCKAQDITPNHPLAHFIDFCKKHKRRNG